MSFLRRLAVYLAGVTLILLLILIVVTVSIIKTAGNPEYVKNTLKASGFYNSFIDNTLNFTKEDQLDPPKEASILINTELEPIIKQTFRPEIIQNTFNQIIDGTYLWLHGKTQLPEFSVDLTDIKANLVSNISSFYQNKVNNLPVCNSYNSYSSFDISTAECIPPGLSIPSSTYTEVASNTINEIPILDKQQITFQSFDVEGANDQNSIWQQVPKYYKWFSWSPVILSIIFAMGMILVFVVLRSHAHSFKVYGRVFLTAGILLLLDGIISILFVAKSLSSVAFSGTSKDVAFSQDAFISVIQHFARSTGWWALYFGLGFTLAGIGLYLLSRKIRKQETTDTTNTSQYLKHRQNGRN